MGIVVLFSFPIIMAKRKSSKDTRPDFLRDQGDRIEKISANDVWSAITLKHEPTRKVVGFLLVVFAAVLAISFTSFFFSWKLDQSLMSRSDDGLSHFNGAAKNAMGYYGAQLAFKFVHNGFGLAAYALLPYVTLTGLFFLFDYRPFSLLRIAVHTILFTVWFSLFLGFALRWWPLLGGSFGFFGNQQIETAIGGVGSFFFLAAYAVAYSMFFFNANPFARIKMNYDANGERLDLDGLEEDGDLVESMAHVNGGIRSEEVIEPSGFEASIHEDFAIEEELNVVDVELEDDAEELTPAQRAALTQISLKITETIEPIVPEIEEEANTNPGAGINTLLGDEDFKVEVMADEADDAVDENTGDNSMERMGIDTVYDPTQELSKYVFPTLDLLQEHDTRKQEIDMEEIQRSKDMIIQTLENYKIGISSIKASVGPTVTLYEIVPAPGVKISKIKNLEDDIALSLAALGIRIIAPIPGKGTIGIEVPNKNPEMVPMRSVLASKKFQDCDFQLPVILGKTISNEIFVADLAKMPHLLMAGATGQGKSVGLNSILVSLLYKKHPAYVKFVLVDPKKVELTLFNKIERHFLAKLPGDGEAIITDNHKVINTLNSLCVEMDNRYKLLQDALVRNIIEYNNKFLSRKLNPNDGHRFLPYIVVVIDEVADLIMTAGKEIETPIARLAQLARAIGIHLILATQRPSVNVITGMIKANFPARIAFRVSSKIDSRTILDANGADQLIGRGDLLYSGGNEIIRLQCPFVDTPEVERIVDFIGEQRAFPTAYVLPEVKEEGGVLSGDGLDSGDWDPMFEDAARVVVLNQAGSTSMIQRKLKIGYNRAGRLMDQLEDAGIVGGNNGSKARQVLITDEHSLNQFLSTLR
ncbi:DNA translocase FtsK [Bacteroidota bacterium]|nr:DNA translocase FtsK [Bacteroidota bacterium]